MTREELTTNIWNVCMEIRDRELSAGNGYNRIVMLIDQYVDWVIGIDAQATTSNDYFADVTEALNELRAEQRTRAEINQQKNK